MKSKTLLNIIRTFLFILFAGFFLPCFTVSCSGQSVDIIPLEAVFGYQNGFGDVVVDPQPKLLVLLLLVVLVLVITFIKKLSKIKKAFCVLGAAFIDLIMWFSFSAQAKDLTEKNYYDFSYRFGFYLNIISLFCLLILSVLVLYKEGFIPSNSQTMTGKWTCSSCQSLNEKESVFCYNCGSKKPDPITCACGTINVPDGIYCKKCGKKLSL